MRLCSRREMTQHCRCVEFHWSGWAAGPRVPHGQCTMQTVQARGHLLYSCHSPAEKSGQKKHGPYLPSPLRPAQLASVFSCLAFQLQSSVPFHPRDPPLSWLSTSTSSGEPASNTTNPTRSSSFSGMFSIASSPAPSIPRFKAMRQLRRPSAVTDRLDLLIFDIDNGH